MSNHEEEGEGRTIFVPGGAGGPTEAPPASQPQPPEPAATQPPPARTGGRLQPGDMLNHIFEVRRYITAGGMGEVWEGVNTHTDERVAIKVMLPQLAADPNVQAMFRKEARTLTRLSHPALVAYRVLAMEPTLGILYIVTEFVDGTNLENRLREMPKDEAALRGFILRLAEGLRAAHDLGAVHRDMSPDNVLLEDDRLSQARIIDFGIAKDMDPGKRTIVGDGFAGKIGYVAPEQLGDFSREVGPWTDVYSLALVGLAVAGGKHPDMGATLVEAVDRRRAGVDVSVAPPGLRPVLAAMLEADPARRLRDMGAVIEALDRVASGPTAGIQRPEPSPSLALSGTKAATTEGRNDTRRRLPLAIGGAGAAGLALAAGVALWLSSAPPEPAATDARSVSNPGGMKVDPVAAARNAVPKLLPTIPCSWLDVRDVRRDGEGVSFALSGVAGDPVSAQAALQQALGKSVVVRSLTADVITLPQELCGVVEAYAQVRDDAPPMLSIDKQRWEMDLRSDSAYPGQKVARVPLHLDTRASADDFAFVYWEKAGATAYAAPGSATTLSRAQVLDLAFVPSPDGRHVFKENNDITAAGLKGIALVRGRGPFDVALVAPPLPVSPGWKDRFLQAAREKDWKVEMIWFQTQDLTPN